MICEKEKGMSDTLMEILTKASSRGGRRMVKASINGKMERCTMENGKKD